MAPRRRKIVEEFFGWSDTVGGLRSSRHVGRWKIAQQVELTAAACGVPRLTQ